jgi:pyruvate/2-oxoglutarate/acetoin dehydrogenase E1 component
MEILASYCDAIRLALIQEMRRDERVFVYGVEDKMFGTLEGIAAEFGEQRCLKMPISEESGLGFGLGAALNGLKPVQTHLRVDFLMLAMNQLVNMVSSCYYGSAGKTAVPIVIRAVVGRGWGQGYQHSKSLQGMFAQIPGLKVVMPTTPSDAKGMIAAAIADHNPVLVLEHRWLYWQQGNVETSRYLEVFGQPAIRKAGKDLTVVATSWMVIEALHAARIMSNRGVELEVIDPRSVTPFNEDLIIASVKKTGYCVVVDNDWLHCGFSAEISSRVYDACWSDLSAPIVRLGLAGVPCPTAKTLESAFYPNAESIVRSIESILGIPEGDLSGEQFFSHENRFIGPF